eukprot:Skav233753  [mRNA]  locus=scaffold1792:300466:304788:- [translate_table: standard]
MESLVDQLSGKWQQMARSLLSEDPNITFLRVTDVKADLVFGHIAKLHAHDGLKVLEPVEDFLLQVPMTHHLSVGDWIGFQGADLQRDRLILGPDDLLWTVSKGLLEEPWTCVHLFAGAFDGWSRAFAWLESHSMFAVENTIELDCDPRVAKSWDLRGYEVVNHKVRISDKLPGTKVGFHGPVSDLSWLNWIRKSNNIWLTMSPPCPSWSNGGVQSGLNCANGISFLEAISVAKRMRPLIISCECSDTIINHPHFAALRFSLSQAGYKTVWSSVNEHADLVNMKRRRWLALFFRRDIASLPIGGTFKVTGQAKPGWDDCTFRFHVPPVVMDQLLLTPDLIDQYGCSRFLPHGWRRDVSDLSDPLQVLRARVILPDSVMPTLCASYTRQHCLDEDHLVRKGIFASLTDSNGTIRFLDPVRFVGLMATPNDQAVPMPVDVPSAFVGLGNCITVTQALLTVSIGLVAASLSQMSIRDAVFECFNNRITADECHVFHDDTTLWVAGDSQVAGIIPKMLAKHGDTDSVLLINDVFFPVSSDDSFAKIFAGLHWDPKQVEQFRCFHEDEPIPLTAPFASIIGKRIRVICRAQLILEATPLTRNADPNLSTEPMQVCDSDEEIAKCIDDIEAQCLAHPETVVTVFHYPHADPTFILCHCDRIHDEATEILTKKYGPHVKTFDVVDLPGFQDQTCILAVHEPIQDNQVCVLWVNVINNSIITEVIARDTTDSATWTNGRWVARHSPRELCALKYGGKVGSDEFQWLSQMVLQDSLVMLQPLIITDDSREQCIHDMVFQVACLWKKKWESDIRVPVWEDGHWSGVEIHFKDLIICSFVSMRSEATKASILAALHSFASKASLQVRSCVCNMYSSTDMCGWTLIAKWFRTLYPTFKWVSRPEANVHAVAKASMSRYLDTDVHIHAFAVSVRSNFLMSSPAIPANLVFGGTGTTEDATMQPASVNKDPWQTKDPWLQPAQVPSSLRNAKWEDLALPSDHQFYSGADQLKQITRQQMSNNQGGVAFCTRSNVPDALTNAPSTPAGILIPVSDAAFFRKLHPEPKVFGPFEVTVSDGVANTIYKRQVMLLQVTPEVRFQPPDAKYKATLTEVRELVLEMDSRIASKETMTMKQQNPQEHLKSRIRDLFPASALQNSSMYGFRTVSKKEDHKMFQMLIKVPLASRATMLEHSGLGEITARDFLAKGTSPEDHSVLPRFWDASRQGREEAVRTASKVDGFAGVVLTKRGIAIRSWNCKLASTRAAVMNNDVRLCPENMSTVPKVQVESSGWPQNITAAEVVRSCHYYTQLAPVPTRCYRSAGVTSWSLMFSSMPSIARFCAAFNGHAVEIVLVPAQSMSMPGPRKGKEPKKSIRNVAPRATEPSPTETAHHDRISNLESRFSLMEKRQETLESRMDSKFSEVNDQLRQILQAVQPRAASHNATGFTPPPKQPKVGP